MKAPARPTFAPKSAEKNKPLTYDLIRDYILSQQPNRDVDYLLYYTWIGAFMFERLQAEELARPDGKPWAYDHTAHVWNECSIYQLEQLHEKIRAAYSQEVQRRRVQTVRRQLAGAMKPLLTVTKGIAWFMRAMAEGFVGAIGILLFALLLRALMPEVIEHGREVANHIFGAGNSSEAVDEAGLNETVENGHRPTEHPKGHK